MRIVKDEIKKIEFSKELYNEEPLYITSTLFWDGGIQTDCALSEKAAFYLVADKMSAIIKGIIRMYGGTVLVGKSFCEHGVVYAKWTDLKRYELFSEISGIIKKNKNYLISLPEDDSVIDLIVESNFRYFSYISLYLPEANIIIQPTCHTEVLIYSKNKECIELLKTVVGVHSCESCKIALKYQQ